MFLLWKQLFLLSRLHMCFLMTTLLILQVLIIIIFILKIVFSFYSFPSDIVDVRFAHLVSDIKSMRLYNKPELISVLYNSLREEGLLNGQVNYFDLTPFDQVFLSFLSSLLLSLPHFPLEPLQRPGSPPNLCPRLSNWSRNKVIEYWVRSWGAFSLFCWTFGG